jgi:hypothetical protein
MAEKLFKKYKKIFIKMFSKKALDNHQLDEIGNNLFGKKYIGTFAQDKFPVNKIGYSIVNVDTSKRINTDKAHWVAIYSTKTKLYVYDSFGRSTKFVLPIIASAALKANKNIIESKRDQEQYGYTEVCGHLCLAWLCVVNDMGILKAITI